MLDATPRGPSPYLKFMSVKRARIGRLNQGFNLPDLGSHDPTDFFCFAHTAPVPETRQKAFSMGLSLDTRA